MVKTGLIIVFVVVVLIVAGYAIKPRPNNIAKIEEFEAYLDKMVKSNNPPGVSLAVVKDGKIVYQYAAGLADGPNAMSATEDTIYHWWSMTKVVTAVGILQLAEQGLVDLDAPVSNYLPHFEIGDEGSGGLITIRQLLRHTSGLPDPVPAIVGWVHTEDEIYDQVELVRQYMPEYGRLDFEPDSKSGYTNYGYMVLGAVIAEVSGQSYEDYVVEHILEPAGMTRTGFLYRDDLAAHEAAGSHPVLNYMTPLLPFLVDMDEIVRERQGMTLWFNRLYLDVTPSSGLIGPANDAARLLIALQNPGQVLSEESLASMMPAGESLTDRPLGWADYAWDEQMWVHHRGGGPGFASIMRLYPEQGLGIVIMANGTNLDWEGLTEAAASLTWK